AASGLCLRLRDWIAGIDLLRSAGSLACRYKGGETIANLVRLSNRYRAGLARISHTGGIKLACRQGTQVSGIGAAVAAVVMRKRPTAGANRLRSAAVMLWRGGLLRVNWRRATRREPRGTRPGRERPRASPA